MWEDARDRPPTRIHPAEQALKLNFKAASRRWRHHLPRSRWVSIVIFTIGVALVFEGTLLIASRDVIGVY